MTGLFITFEGGEGAGKSTQIKTLADHFISRDRAVVMTREPGGAPSAETIRNLLVNGEPGKWSATAEALLNYAARDAHLRATIRPALAADKVVLCDRFMDSTRAYQGYGGDCPLTLIDALEQEIVGATLPDVTVIFDLQPELGLARARARGAGIEDRYERKGLAFHEELRKGFLAVAAQDPERCFVVDASQSIDAVWKQIHTGLKARGHG